MERKIYLERYRVIHDANGVPEQLGSSVAGVTYKAEDIESGDLVAVELVRSDLLGPAALQQLEEEAPKAHQLKHVNIARVHDVGVDGEHVVYVREFLEGSTLQEWVTTHGALPVATVLRIASQVVAALAAASFHAIRHRTIQPANLMIVPGQTPEGEWPLVKVLNFGAPPPAFQRSGFTTVGVGNSAQFASPEQLVGGNVDFRSEIYSLGCTLWFLLTGAPPATDVAVARFSGVPKNVRRLISQMVAVDADERPKDPVTLQEQIRECLSGADRREAIGRRFGMPFGNRGKGKASAAPVAVAAAATPAVVPAAVVAPAVDPEPLAPAANITHLPRRTFAWKPLAAAAALVALGALGAIVLTDRGGDDRRASTEKSADAIGVPVGVPEREAAKVATVVNADTASPAAQQAAEPAVEPAAPASNAVAANTRSDTQVAAAPAPAADSNLAAPAENAAPATEPSEQQFAANAVPPSANPPTVLSTHEPPPSQQTTDLASPAEGPAANNQMQSAPPAPAPEQPARYAEESTTTAPSRADEPQPAAVKSETTQRKTASTESTAAPARVKTAKAAAPAAPAAAKPQRTQKPAEVRRAEPVTDDELPDVPQGSRRAKYVGTNPDGSMVFSLPDSEPVYAAPPTIREERGPRRKLRKLLGLPPPSERIEEQEVADPEEEIEDE